MDHQLKVFHKSTTSGNRTFHLFLLPKYFDSHPSKPNQNLWLMHIAFPSKCYANQEWIQKGSLLVPLPPSVQLISHCKRVSELRSLLIWQWHLRLKQLMHEIRKNECQEHQVRDIRSWHKHTMMFVHKTLVRRMIHEEIEKITKANCALLFFGK